MVSTNSMQLVSPNMLQNLDMYSLLGIIEFCAFLLSHLDAIHPKVIGLVFNNNTEYLANHIAKTLSGYQQLCFNADVLAKTETSQDCDLLINFAQKDTKFRFGAREFILQTTRQTIPIIRPSHRKPDSIFLAHNELVVKTYKSPITFVTSKFISWSNAELHGTLQRDLVDSFQWYAFLDHVRCLPIGKYLNVIDDIYEDSNGVAINSLNPPTLHANNQVSYISGFKVGIYRIVAERISNNGFTFEEMNNDKVRRFVRLPPTRFRDKRLSWRYWKISSPSEFTFSLIWNPFKTIYTHARSKRYVILVPRIVIEDSSETYAVQLASQCLVIVGLLLVTSTFFSLRFCCQWANNVGPIYKSSLLVICYFDTLSRLLGNSIGRWPRPSVSEHQLQIVIGVCAILFSSIFSGVLYEDKFAETGVKFKYNSLKEVCNDGLKVGLPWELYIYHMHDHRLNER